MIVDVVGTLDECRFTHNGLHVSKEIARQYYNKTEWYKDVEEAKKKAEKEGIRDWKKLVKTQPPKLDPKLRTMISQMYKAATNEITGARMFEVPKLADIVKECKPDN
jgi:phosphoribosylaminoimidazole-succinocarboxamide synthase